MSAVRCALLLLLAATTSLLHGAANDIRALLVNRVDEGKKAEGIVVATIGPGTREVVPYGVMAKDRPESVNGNTVFEIGSVTKVFTCVILADMVAHGEVKLETPVADLLPKTVRVPQRNGKQITLLDLAMHISGLPRMPPDYKPADLENPFAGFDTAQLYKFLSSYTLPRDIGAEYEYSNLGSGLLAHALALRAGMSYNELLRLRILDPLGMTSTSIVLSADQKRRLATGYDGTLLPAKNWDFDVLAGALALRSTANDLLNFLSACLELSHTPLDPAMRIMQSVRHRTENPDIDVLLGWHVWRRYGGNIIWHNGVTGGYWSFLGFDPVKKTGAVVLSNTRFDNDAIGLHILDSRWPVEKLNAPKERVAREMDPQLLSHYTGVYRFGPNYSITVSLEHGHLYVRDTRAAGLELLSEDENNFFFKTIDAQVSFVKDPSGKTTKMILHVNDDDSVGMKMQ